ncbi:Hypothetical protein A7982_02218 [Minicystis rosea]|nr:Hypothetical protein A7982_02218 [Minicystis rosea]
MRIAVPVFFVAFVALAQATSSMGCGSDAQSHTTGSTSASSSGAGPGGGGGNQMLDGGPSGGGNQQDAGPCVDHDGDQHGADCAAGPDCNDDDDSIWENCTVTPNGPPGITSTTMDGGTLTVNGLNFGAKTTAAPLLFLPFTSGTDGQSTTEAGFDLIEGNNAKNAKLNTASGIGGGSIRCLETDESFHEFAKSFPRPISSSPRCGSASARPAPAAPRPTCRSS